MMGAPADASFGVDEAYGGFIEVTGLARMDCQPLRAAVEEGLLHGLFKRRPARATGGATLSADI